MDELILLHFTLHVRSAYIGMYNRDKVGEMSRECDMYLGYMNRREACAMNCYMNFDNVEREKEYISPQAGRDQRISGECIA